MMATVTGFVYTVTDFMVMALAAQTAAPEAGAGGA